MDSVSAADFWSAGRFSCACGCLTRTELSDSTMQPAIKSDLTYTVQTPARDFAAGLQTIIESERHGLSPDLRELWMHRELLLFLVWRDIKVRYQQTVLGAAWAVLQPLLTMFVFAL